MASENNSKNGGCKTEYRVGGSSNPSRLMCGRCKRFGHTNRSRSCPLFGWTLEDIMSGIIAHANLKSLVDALLIGRINVNPSNAIVEQKPSFTQFKNAKLSSKELKIRQSRILVESHYRSIDKGKSCIQLIPLPGIDKQRAQKHTKSSKKYKLA